MTVRTLTASAVLAVAIGGCGSSGSSNSAPDVSGAPTTDQATLFKASNLQRVLGQVKGRLQAGAQLTTVKIEPRDVKAVASGRVVTVDNAGRSLTVITPTIPDTGGSVSLSAIDPAVIERLTAQAATAAHKTLKDIAYVAVTVDPISKRPGLGVYMTDQSFYTASIDGTGLKAHGSGSSAPPPAAGGGAAAAPPSPGAGQGSGTVIDPQRIAACIQNAGGDPDKIKACTGH